MGKWKEVKLDNILEKITKGTTPPRGVGFVAKGINYIKSDAIGYDGRINKEKFVQIDFETHQKFKRSQLEENDILFSMAGAYLGKNALVKKEMLPANTNQALAILRLNQNLSLPKYINYYLIQPQMIDFVNNMSGQSAQPNINFQEISSIDLLLPPLEEQKAIAEVLSSLDDKIDLLHRQNKTLEELAQTLFRQWFIEEANDEWGVGMLEDIIHFNPTHSLRKGEMYPFLEMGNVQTFKSSVADWYKRAFTSGTKFKNGDTLLARITPSLENGKTAYVNFLEDDEIGWGSTEFIVMRMKEDYHPFISYLVARNEDFREFAIGNMTGSTGRQRAQAKDIKEYEISIPPTETIQRLNEVIKPIPIKIKENSKQIKILENMRDTLLPKLMSGDVRVKYE